MDTLNLSSQRTPSTPTPLASSASERGGFRMELHVLDWEAWAGPALADKQAWKAWAGTQEPWENPPPAAAPVASMPALLRRRADSGDRLALEIAFRLAPPGESIPTVFSSRHGQVMRSAAMLKAQAAGEPASPMDFSLSVHNAASGLFSIAAGNRGPSSSLSSRGEGLTAGLLEAQGMIAEGHAKVLLVVSDPVPPDVYRGAWEEEPAGYALGLLLGESGGEAIGFVRERAAGEGEGADGSGTPQALAFLKLLAGGGASASWQRGGHRTAWNRP